MWREAGRPGRIHHINLLEWPHYSLSSSSPWTHAHTHTHTYTDKHARAHTHERTHTHASTHTHSYVCMRTHTHTHTCTHTHFNSLFESTNHITRDRIRIFQRWYRSLFKGTKTPSAPHTARLPITFLFLRSSRREALASSLTVASSLLSMLMSTHTHTHTLISTHSYQSVDVYQWEYYYPITPKEVWIDRPDTTNLDLRSYDHSHDGSWEPSWISLKRFQKLLFTWTFTALTTFVGL